MIEQLEAIQGSPVVLMYRVAKSDGSLLVQADVEGVTVHSQDMEDDESAGTQEYQAAACVFDTLQRDGRWNGDAIGYNVAVTVPASLMPEGDREYQIDVRLLFVNGETDQLRPFQVQTQRTYGAE